MSTTSLDDAFREYQRTGSPVALGEAFDLLAPELLLVAMHMVRNTDQAEELVQATFLAAIEAAPRFDPSRPVRPWMVGILANQALRERKRRRRTIDPDRLLPASEDDPVDAAQAAEFADAAAAALQQLPHTYREVLTLHWVHGLTATQIAQALGRAPATVRTHLHRGRQILMRLLPAGLTGALLALVTSERGLAAVRGVVVARAEEIAAGHAAVAEGTLPGEVLLPGGALVSGAVLGHGRRLALLFAPLALLGGALLVVLPLWQGSAAPSPATVAEVAGERGEAGDRSPALEPAGALRSPLAPEPRAVSGLLVHVRYADGSGAAGARFSVVPVRGTHPMLSERWITTDAEGVALVPDCPPGALRLAGDRGGVVVADAASARASPVVLTLPRGVDVQGEVLDGKQKPVAGARIFVSRAGILDEGIDVTESDAAGAFVLRSVEPGRCLSAVAPGYCAARLRPVRPADAGARITLLLDEPAVRLTGRVRDESGRPVAGAKIMVGDKLMLAAPHDPERAAGSSPPLWLESDADGAFASASLPRDPQCHVRVRSPGWFMIAGSIRVDPERGADLDVMVQPGVVLQGRALDLRGEPLADAHVLVRDNTFDRTDLGQHVPSWGRSETWTDARGGFRLDGLPPLPLLAIVSGPGRLRASRAIEAAAGEIVSWHPVLAESLGITGRLRDEHGTPLAGWRIELQGDPTWAPVVPATTDAAGRFSLEGCEAGAYRVFCRRPADQWAGAALVRHPVHAGSVPLELTVPAAMLATARLTGRIIDASGLEGAVRLQVCDGRMEWGSVPVDPASGRFASPLLPPGRYRLQAGHEAMQAGLALAPVELVAGATHDCGDTRLEPPGELRVRLEAPDGTTPGPSAAMVGTADGTNVTTLPLERGRGHVRLWPGAYRIHLRHDIPSGGAMGFTIPSLGRTDLALALAPAGPRRFVIEAPDDGEDLRVEWRCESGGRLLCTWQGMWKRHANPVQEVTLRFPPGAYRVALTDHAGRRAAAGFEVATGEAVAEPIRLELR